MTVRKARHDTRRVRVSDDFGGIELDVVDVGTPGNPVVVLAHGFPESSHSWRHQIDPLVAAGYRVLVPDQRGYGASSAPREVDAYRSDHLADDLVALLDDVDAATATIVGHDWGALVAWDLARYHPERVAAMVNVSVPYTPWPMAPTELFKAVWGDRFFYMLYFQIPERPEREMETDIALTLRATIWSGSAEMFREPRDPSTLPSLEEGTFVDGFIDSKTLPPGLPAWLPQQDFDRYVEQFTTSGFFGPVGWYRNLDADWQLTKDLAAPSMPCAFIGGAKDGVIAHRMEYVEAMRDLLPDYRGAQIIEDAGHWTQQEKPAEFNAALLNMLSVVQS